MDSARARSRADCAKVAANRHNLRILATHCARVLQIHSPQKKRAQGRPGARCTRGPVCKSREENAHEHTGSAEAVRPSLRDGFTVSFVLSPARPGLFATVVLKKLASQELDTSHWGVRTTRLRRPRALALVWRKTPRPPHPTARVVTCATPLSSGGMAIRSEVCIELKRNIFRKGAGQGFGDLPGGLLCRTRKR